MTINSSIKVTCQLNVETFSQSFCNVYTFGPTFRVENSNTVKHAAEFWMVEPEICFADLADDMIKYIFQYVIYTCPEKWISLINLLILAY